MHVDTTTYDFPRGTGSVLVGMSGGVDSSVAALLLAEGGFDVCGFTCRMFHPDTTGEQAPDHSHDEAQSARNICLGMGVSHHIVDSTACFAECVIERFVAGYDSGLTPNPCIDCNRYVKFGDMHRRRIELGADYLATGHYARTRFDKDTGRWQLLRAADSSKDQSYVLYALTQEQLAHTVFPLGNMTKAQVRDLAAQAGLPCAHKPESQDICFIPDGDYAGLIERWASGHGRESICLSPGAIEDENGRVLGQHQGIARYTIGQRKGIGLAAPQPLYVIGKDASRNVLVVGARESLMTTAVCAANVNFVGATEEELRTETRVMAKCSYKQDPRSAQATFDGKLLHLQFDEPLPKVAPGQAVVLYDATTAECVLAGGTAC